MYALAVTAAFLASALFSSATPTGTQDLVPRACSTVFPTFINSISEANPTSSTNGMTVEVALDDNNGTLQRRDVLVRFDNIPAGAYGCHLEAVFPAGATVTRTGSSSVNVFTLDRLTESGDTFETDPNDLNLFGTINFSSNQNEAQRTTINTAACESSLSYRLRIASATTAGSVNFEEIAGTQGLRITYNC
ncbi:hypothetical protein MMC16_007337 [Acarospora aff. strigata]|nr:hypothetical protein [Acarospora aff. strigata]